MQTKDHRVTEHPGERIDDLQRCGCRIIQNEELFCFGMDAVLLAAFAQPKISAGAKVLDLCSGNGVIPILLDARMQGSGVHFTGVEINNTCVDMARRSALMNGQQDRIRFIEHDIRQECGQIAPASFDIVTVNPPYMTGGAGLTGENYAKTIARHEVLCGIEDVAAAASSALHFGGRVFMVHRPHRLGDIFRAFSARDLEIKRMRMVHPYADREANMVLIEASKGGKPYIHVESPLIIYEGKGIYTQEVRELYG